MGSAPGRGGKPPLDTVVHFVCHVGMRNGFVSLAVLFWTAACLGGTVLDVRDGAFVSVRGVKGAFSYRLTAEKEGK